MPDPEDGDPEQDQGEDSVTVADLLARIPVGTGNEPAGAPDPDQFDASELLRREGRGPEEAPPTQRSGRTFQVVAAVIGLVLTCVVVVASTAALSGPRTDRRTPDVVAPPLAGADAVRPDVITAALTSRAPPGAERFPPPPVPRTPPQGGLGETLDPVRDPVRDPVLATVTTFYQTAPTAPADAFGLLGPRMRAPGYESFEASWAGVAAVRIEAISRAGPRAAVATVTLTRVEGGALRTVARLVVGGGPELRIEDATLLSAVTR